MKAEVLRPACDVFVPGLKVTKPVNFVAEKKLFGSVATPILEALTTSRTKLLCECRDFNKASQINQWTTAKVSFQMDTYLQSVSDYLSLLKGFTEQPTTVSTKEDKNDEEDKKDNEDDDKKEEGKPLLAEKPSSSSQDLIPFTCCEWLELMSSTSVFSINVHHEYAHALLASGCICLQRTSDLVLVSIIQASRDFEYDEPKLKEAYNLLLRLAGLFDALLSYLGLSSSSSGAELSEESLQQWRAQQTNAANANVQSLNRIKEFEQGNVVQALQKMALAQAQELVVLRGVTKESVDWVLMGKLSRNISQRYSELKSSRHPFQAWCSWKAEYYGGLSFYYQGVAEWVKNNGASCAQAIAQYQAAKDVLDKLSNKEVQRSKEIVQRDLDIATARNNTIYHEKIPVPFAPLDPVSLVNAQAFQTVECHTLWKETPNALNTRKAPPVPQADESTGCSCTIS
ncbi:unnamed protein product [Aphanomyces euteiches]|nr:hypothetical protein AeRB84_015211 [Aphanomyces euteiches]